MTVACPPGGDLAARARERHATWVRLDMRRSPHHTDLRAALRLRSLARGHAVVHLYSSKAGAVGRLALMSLGRGRPPSVFTPHGWSWLVGGWLAPVYRRFERLMIPVTMAVVAVSAERCTGLGRWLRAAHLDELPQLVSVVRGQMSLVGPRPERPYYTSRFAKLIPRYEDRHRMHGGMTGWAQVHGLSGDTSIPERVRFDNYYIEHWSLWLDLTILARTLTQPLSDVADNVIHRANGKEAGAAAPEESTGHRIPHDIRQ